MSKRTPQLEPEVQILQLFNGLSDESKRITLGLLKAGYNPQQVAVPVATKGDSKRSSPSKRGLPTITKCGRCGNPEGHALHQDSSYGDYHPFVSSSGAATASGKSSSKKGAAPPPAASSEIGKDDVLAAQAGSGAGGD